MIEGVVVDQAGNPVPNATVTLLQDGELWHKYAVPYGRGGTNPQSTFIYDDNPGSAEGEGVYYFGLLDAGNYTVMAQKGNYSGSADVTVSKDTASGMTLWANVSLNGYHTRGFTEKELTYSGGITGIIQDYYTAEQGSLLPHATVTLRLNGQPADTPKNPQSSSARRISPATGNYLFEHLMPGQYQVTVEAPGFDGIHNLTKSTVVGNEIVNVSFLFGRITIPNPSHMPSTVSQGPAMAASTSPQVSSPAPLPGLLTVAGLICAAALLVKRRG